MMLAATFDWQLHRIRLALASAAPIAHATPIPGQPWTCALPSLHRYQKRRCRCVGCVDAKRTYTRSYKAGKRREERARRTDLQARRRRAA